MKWLSWIFLGIVLVGIGYLIFTLISSRLVPEEKKPWLILYASEADEPELEKYDPIIFDLESHPPLDELKEQSIQIYARLDATNWLQSLSSVKGGKKFEAVLNWMDEIVQQQIPPVLISGFNGLFIDGLQGVEKKERDIMVQLILMLKMRYPSIPIIVKDAYALMPQIGDSIHGFLTSSITTIYNRSAEEYQFVDTSIHEERVDRLKKIQKEYPELTIFVLDFWDPSDKNTINEIYEIEEKNSFRVYVGNESLDEIVTRS